MIWALSYDLIGNTQKLINSLKTNYLGVNINLPERYSLELRNYPNPFNPITTITFSLPEDELVNITIYNMVGRKINTLLRSKQTAGFKSIQWNATNNQGQPVSAGVYLMSIQAGQFSQTKKMVLLK